MIFCIDRRAHHTFSSYCLGIDRDVVIGAKVNLDKFIDDNIGVDDYLSLQFEHFNRLMNMNLDDETDDVEYHREICDITILTFLPYYIKHLSVVRKFKDKEDYRKQIKIFENLIEDKDLLLNNQIEEMVLSYRLNSQMRE